MKGIACPSAGIVTRPATLPGCSGAQPTIHRKIGQIRSGSCIARSDGSCAASFSTKSRTAPWTVAPAKGHLLQAVPRRSALPASPAGAAGTSPCAGRSGLQRCKHKDQIPCACIECLLALRADNRTRSIAGQRARTAGGRCKCRSGGPVRSSPPALDPRCSLAPQSLSGKNFLNFGRHHISFARVWHKMANVWLFLRN